LRTTSRLSTQLLIDTLPVALFSAGNFLFFLFGINKTTANAAVIIYTATPITVALLSHRLIREHISRQKITGILIGLGGVLIILLLPILEQTHLIVGDIQGNLLIVGAVIMFALYNVGSRHLIVAKSYHPLTITGMSLFVSAVCFILLLFLFPHKPIFPPLLALDNISVLLYLAIFVTVVPYVLHQWAIKHSSATTGSLTGYIQPIFGFILNGILLGEIITGRFFAGSLLVFFGTFLATGTEVVRMMKRKGQ
jgi:drug/metabolite transporter (DMT)-like permease